MSVYLKSPTVLPSALHICSTLLYLGPLSVWSLVLILFVRGAIDAAAATAGLLINPISESTLRVVKDGELPAWTDSRIYSILCEVMFIIGLVRVKDKAGWTFRGAKRAVAAIFGANP
mmetsp:Transcript_7438/g.15531  ORF Transcript_7438/g.15531 Transcript_7438/m.15531 type:complete len:117 (-) Transcript_7438:541-891(-)